jgi:hypothetical protein
VASSVAAGRGHTAASRKEGARQADEGGTRRTKARTGTRARARTRTRTRRKSSSGPQHGGTREGPRHRDGPS